MANANITAWLNIPQKDYATGVLLYNQFGSSKLLKTFFANGKGDYHMSRLKETLEKLNPTLTEPATPVPMIIPPAAALPAKKIYSLTDSEWDKAPDPIKELFISNQQLNSHTQLLHHQIRVSGSRQGRLDMALLLLHERDQINSNWTVIKNYQATGKVTEKITEESKKGIAAMTIPELIAVTKNCPPNISKDRKKLSDMKDGSKKDKVAARLQENEILLQLAKERLANV